MLFYRYNVGERVEKRHLITIETVIKCLSNCFFVGCEKTRKMYISFWKVVHFVFAIIYVFSHFYIFHDKNYSKRVLYSSCSVPVSSTD